ncbi:MAG: TetR/AcrR family transcriptional regulator [Deltaproteobacteria bacterium]|nr:TetR/AcrR family transcriptional regulator [Deltaproteobacteria bacterium]
MVTPTFATLKEEEKDARRRLILDTARKLFSKKDFRSVTVRQIAGTAGVSIGTIYNYYENIDDLFLDIFIKSGEEVTRLLDEKTGRMPQTSLVPMCEAYISFLNENMTFFKMMGHFMLNGGLSSEASGKLNQIMRPIMDRIENILIAVGVSSETRLTAHALFSALNGIMVSYAKYPGRTPGEISLHTLRLSNIIAKVFESNKNMNHSFNN